MKYEILNKGNYEEAYNGIIAKFAEKLSLKEPEIICFLPGFDLMDYKEPGIINDLCVIYENNNLPIDVPNKPVDLGIQITVKRKGIFRGIFRKKTLVNIVNTQKEGINNTFQLFEEVIRDDVQEKNFKGQ